MQDVIGGKNSKRVRKVPYSHEHLAKPRRRRTSQAELQVIRAGFDQGSQFA